MWIIIGLVLALAVLASIVQLFMGGSPGEAWHDDANDPKTAGSTCFWMTRGSQKYNFSVPAQ